MFSRTHRLQQRALGLLSVLLLAFLLSNSTAAMTGVRQGLSLCGEVLFPSLFPFLVLSELLVVVGANELLGKVAGRPFRALFGLCDSGAGAFLLGGLCGLPVATATAVNLYEKGEISKRELERIVLLGNNPSPGFLIVAVGEVLFASKALGVALFVITLLSATLTGLLLRLREGRVDTAHFAPNGGCKSMRFGDLTRCIRHAFTTMLGVCAFVLFFSAAASSLSALLSPLTLPVGVEALLYGALELTSGVRFAVSALSPDVAFCAVCLFAAFGGLSVCLQVFSLLEGTGLHARTYLLVKGLQGGIALLLAQGYIRIFRPTLSTSSSVPTFAYQHGARTLVGVTALLLLLLFLERVAQKRKSPR